MYSEGGVGGSDTLVFTAHAVQGPPIPLGRGMAFCLQGGEIARWVPPGWSATGMPLLTKLVHRPLAGCQSYVCAPVSQVMVGIERDCLVRATDLGNQFRSVELQHTTDVASVAAAAGGRLIATTAGDRNGTMSLWRVAWGAKRSPRKRLVFVRQAGYAANRLAISPDGRRVAQAGQTGTVIVTCTQTKRHVYYDIPGCSGVESLCFSLDGDLLVVGTNSGGVATIDVDERRILWSEKCHDDRTASVGFTIDTTSVFSGSAEIVAVRSTASGHLKKEVTGDGWASGIAQIPTPVSDTLAVQWHGREDRVQLCPLEG